VIYARIIFRYLFTNLPFLPIALALYVSFSIMRATDMTLDGSFVLELGYLRGW